VKVMQMCDCPHVWGVEEEILQRFAEKKYGRRLERRELGQIAQLLREEFRASGLEEELENMIAAVVEDKYDRSDME